MILRTGQGGGLLLQVQFAPLASWRYQDSNEIICPTCKENCLIEIKDYKISLYGCKNYHRKNNILLSEFKETQKINISDIICNICKERNKGNTHNNDFYHPLIVIANSHLLYHLWYSATG